MQKCWCGNEDFLPYSNDYNRCSYCNSLVAVRDFSQEIVDVQDEEEDLYGSNYWQKTMTKEAGVDTLEDIIELYLTGRAVYWLAYILKYVKLGGEGMGSRMWTGAAFLFAEECRI